MKKAIAILAAAASFCLAQEAPAEAQQCEKTYNINEIVFNLRNGFQRQLRECSSRLAWNTALTDPDEKREFVAQCVTDGAREGIPKDFSATDEFVGIIDGYVQGILSASSTTNGEFYPKKFMNTIDGISINELLDDVGKLSGECVVNEPYEPPTSWLSLGERMLPFGLLIMTGFNFSHTYAESSAGYYSHGYYGGSGTYKAIPGVQLGFAFDIPATDLLYIQPGFVYVRKGIEDDNDRIIAQYIEIPLLLSFKFSVPNLNPIMLRLNAGTYFGICLATDAKDIFSSDFGLSMGAGVDIINTYYIGMFYSHGLTDISDRYGLDSYNRTIGLNVGMYL